MKLLEKLFGKTTDDSYKPRKAVWARITNVEPDDETYVKITLEPTDSTVNVSFPPIQIRNPVEDTEEYRKLKCVYEACDLRILPRDDIVSRELLLEHMRHRLVGSTLPIMEPEPEPERKACPVTI